MKSILTFVILLVLSSLGEAQAQTQTRTAPDCQLSFSFTVTGVSADLNNVPQLASGGSTGGCSVFVVTVEGFNSGAGTITFQGSESNVAGTGPASYGTFAGTTVSGSNPVSSFPSTFVATGWTAWLRVSATVSAGTLRGTIQGWRQQTGTSGGGGGGSTVVTNFTTCQSGSNTIKSSPISISGSGLTQIVAASGSTVITVCSLSLSSSATTNITIENGTGAACGTGTTAVSGVYQSVLSIALDSLNLALPASNALCLNSSASVTAGGLVMFVQQ